MLVYIVTLILSLMCAYASDKVAGTGNENSAAAGKKLRIRINRFSRTIIRLKGNPFADKSIFLAFLSFLPLYIVSAIRYMVGTDYSGTYRTIYNYTYNDGWHFSFNGETLYGLLNKIASIYSGDNYIGVFALSSLVVIGFIFWGLRNQSVNFTYSVLLFVLSGYYFWSFNAVRQMAAMAIFLYAYRFVEERKPFKYLFFIILAYGFHTVALLYLPVYFIGKVKVNFPAIISGAVILVIFPTTWRDLAYGISSRLAVFSTYVERYFDSSKFSSYTESSLIHVLINALFLALYIVISLIYDKKREKSNVWINFQIIAFGFSALASILPLANRLSRMFSIMQILSIPVMTGLISDKRIRILINLAIIICFAMYSYVTFYVLGYHDVFPYRTIFNR